MKLILLISLLLSPFMVAAGERYSSPLCTTSSYSSPDGFYHPGYDAGIQRYIVCLDGYDVTDIIAGKGYVTSQLAIGSGTMDMLYTVHNDYERSPGYVVHAYVDGNRNIVRDIVVLENAADDPKHALLNLRLEWLSRSGFVYLTSYPDYGPASIHSFVIPENSYRTSWIGKKLHHIINGKFYSPSSLSPKQVNKERFVVEQHKVGENGAETFFNLVSYNGTKICELDRTSRFWLTELNCR